ncbi:MAG: TonB-dependent receptor [Novosphingobium sp.]|uniref:TonB-dependent siderophore receptor n=1 Tax=Novosphingobium sp. TaxID=1874826 RepID=UPI0012CB1D21|nr:TonB-dependent receptor [Novosphingobium sp.]MPS68851.1 TonB-dependent receptor [Novosphingobium sp.]
MTRWKSALNIALATGCAMIAFPACAEEAAAPENASASDIVVNGKREQYRGDVPLKEVPQSIQQIDGKMLADLNITRLDSALDLASGIARQNNFGGLWDAFAIRGFAGDENFPSGFLVNGFNGGRGYGGPRDASNIERIDILKGPNGAVFGRGEPGGTVNIITKKATTDDSFGSFAVSGGSYDTYRIEGDYNLKLTDNLALRVNGAAQEADSFRDYIWSRKKVLTPSVLFRPGVNTTLTYEMEVVDQYVFFDRGTIAVDGELGVVPRSRFFGEPGDGPNHITVFGHQAQAQQDLGGDWVVLAGFNYRETTFDGYSSDAELSGSRQTLEETGNYLARQRRYRDYDTTYMAARAEISGKLRTGPFTHHVLIGADWDKFEIDTLSMRFRPAAYTAGSPITAANNAIDIYNPVYGQLPATSSVVQDTFETQRAWGIYFQDQIDITDRFKIRGGGRFDHFNQKIDTGIHSTRTRFSPSVGLLYELTDTFSLYASYGTGFRPNSGVDAAGSAFAPETSKSYEAGLRYVSPDNAITASLAAYHMKKNGVLTADPLNAGFSLAGGKARSRGIEADINANLPGGFKLYATYAYTDAVWTESALDPAFGLTINPGDPLINIPKHAGNLLVTKEFDAGNAGVFTLGGGISAASKRLGETGYDFWLPGYTLVRAMASYKPSEQIKFSLDVTNLFDKTWYAASYHRYWITPGTPRTITLRADFSF